MTAAAGLELARRKVNRAAGLLRDVSRELAQATGDLDVFTVVRCHDAASLAEVHGLVQHAMERYGEVELVVVPAVRRRTPTTAPNGAKENSHARSTQEAARSR